MRKGRNEVLRVCLVGGVFAALTLTAWLKPADAFSASERRKLSQFPEFSVKSVKTGLFMTQLESYLVDQFPWRDELRGWKALTYRYGLGQKDNHEVYLEQGVLSKLQYPYQPAAAENACAKFQRIYDRYLKDSETVVYTALIPDKNYFLAEENGYPSMDYQALYADYQDGMESIAEYIELSDWLSLEDYYRTDTHWRQEKIQDAAAYLAAQMGVKLQKDYEPVTLDLPFYGVYYGQAALPVPPDSITYMDQALFQTCEVYDYQNQREIPIYNLELAKGRDPYEMFLSGSLSVITIENPQASTEKELVLFRDSFGSSIAPYFVEAYQKITLLDARYLHEALIGNYVTFTDQDVLFLHSTSVIGNESAF